MEQRRIQKEKYGKRAHQRVRNPVPQGVPPRRTSGILSPAFRKLPSSRLMMPALIPPVYHGFQNENCWLAISNSHFGKTIP
jgi:hypothetical protein